MAESGNSNSALWVALASRADREQIYQARHRVYAEELHQHALNPAQRLTDALDEFNEYIVVKQGESLQGFISITPPGRSYSVEKYFTREQMPVQFDGVLYEIRLLTVLGEHRGRMIAGLLMYAALRWVEWRGGRQLIAIGRREVVPMYEACGVRPLGMKTQSGAVEYELMTASTQEVHEAIEGREKHLSRLQHEAEWTLPFPFQMRQHCAHGGAFWEALGEELDQLQRASTIVSADVLDAWFDPAPAVIESLRENLSLLLKTSPPTYAEGLVKTIARKRGVPEECVLAAGGSSALIFLALQRWLGRGARVLLVEPMYGEYRHVTQQVIQCEVQSVVMERKNEFRLDCEEVARAAEGCDLVVMVNPNSPTGNVTAPKQLEQLFEKLPDVRFWIDETYVEYAGQEYSVEQIAARRSNVFVCKSMSKVYALSGARVAYMVGDPEELARLARGVPPWAVSLPAQAAAIAALHSGEYYKERYAETERYRTELSAGMRPLGIMPLPSVANFLLCDLPEGVLAEDVVRKARQQGVFLRSGAGIHPSLGLRTLRVAVKSEGQNRRVLEVLGGILRES